MSLSKSGLPEPPETPISRRKKILWLVSWYPNRYDAFDGDFIQRHARAAAAFDDIMVLFVKLAAEQSSPEEVVHRREGLTEKRIYLPKRKGLPGKLYNLYRWQNVFKKEAAALIQKERPQMVHVQVPWKAGLIALWLNRKFNIPFLVTEHWGIYNTVVDDHIYTRSLFMRRLLRRIYQKTKVVVSVSHFLGEGINRTLLPKPYAVVPNVVDTNLFFPVASKTERFTFLHVSNMVPLKNVAGMLEAFQRFLTKTKSGARLLLIGNRDEQFVQLAGQMALLDRFVFFLGEVPYPEVARQMQASHVLVLNSDMENSPCVIGEALCCGLPVIATSVGGIPELVTPENGFLVPPRDVQALATAFETIEAAFSRFDAKQIAFCAKQTFSMAAVGNKLHQLYHA